MTKRVALNSSISKPIRKAKINGRFVERYNDPQQGCQPNKAKYTKTVFRVITGSKLPVTNYSPKFAVNFRGMINLAVFISGHGSNALAIARYFATHDQISVKLILSNNATSNNILGLPR